MKCACQFDLKEQILHLQDGDHLCLLYDQDPAEQMPALLPFIVEGLAQGDQFIYIADDQTVGQLETQLQAAGVDTAAEAARGALQLGSRDEWRQPGELSSERQADQVRDMVKEAQKAGFKGVRCAVEMTWTLGPDVCPKRLEHWEATINTVFVPGFPGRMICQYNRSRMTPEVVLVSLRTHPLAIIGHEVHPNIFYQAPLILNDAANGHLHRNGNSKTLIDGHAIVAPRDVDSMIAQLQRARAAEKEREDWLQKGAGLAETQAGQTPMVSTEEHLRTSEERLAQLMELMPAAAYTCDVEGRITFFNRRAVELWGRTPRLNDEDEKFCGAFRLWRLDGSRMINAETPAARAIRDGTQTRNGEVIIERPDSSRVFVSDNVDPLYDSAGHRCGAINVFQDITERKSAEKELLEYKNRLSQDLADTKRLHELSTRLLKHSELVPLLDEVLRTAAEMMGTNQGNVQIYDAQENVLRIVAHFGFSQAFLDQFQSVPMGYSVCGTALEKRERIIVEDASRDPRFAELAPIFLKHGFVSVQSTPLIGAGGKFLGMLSNHFATPRVPTERELRLLDLFAEQAVRVIERHQAQNALAEAMRQKDALYDFLERRHRTRTLEDLYDAGLDAITVALRCTRASILLFDDRDAMRFVAWRGLSEGYRRAVGNHSPWKRTEVDPQPICIPNVATAEIEVALKQVILSEGIGALAFIPLVTDGSLAGKFMIYYDAPHVFTEEEIELSLTFARQLANGIERTRGDIAARRLAAIVESSEDAIISKDLKGKITSWNRGAERLFGYRAEEMIGQSITVLFPADRDNEEPQILEVLHRGERIEHYETVRRRKDGSLVDISLTVSPIKNAEGQIVGASKTARDITERKRAHEKLEQTVAERTIQLRDTIAELEAFSYSIAHDMRAPLRAMTSFARLLQEDFADRLPEEGKSYARRITVSAERLDRLIRDVLNYSKISRGEMTLEGVDVEKLTREIIDSYSHLQEAGGTILIQSPMPRVLANHAALTQCISNLLSNGVKFVRPGTKPDLRVWAEPKGEFLRLWFGDNGIGISEEGRTRIFDMFQRLNPASEFDGNGIGLTIVRKAVERMGGRLGVESTPGVGSNFWIELKRAN